MAIKRKPAKSKVAKKEKIGWDATSKKSAEGQSISDKDPGINEPAVPDYFARKSNTQETEPLSQDFDPVFLTRKGNTRLSMLRTSEPWTLEVDALVLPVNSEGDPGGLGQAFIKFLKMNSKMEKQAWEFEQIVKKKIQYRPISPPRTLCC